MSIDRRQFILKTGASLAVGSVMQDLAFTRSALAYPASTLPSPLPSATPILVTIQLDGGNDALNTHIPIAVPGVTSQYRAGRPALAVTSMTSSRPYSKPPAGVYLPPALDLDGRYGLHGNLVWLANRWHSRGDVAIVQGIGENVVKERSHFAAIAFRAAAAFSGGNLASGWLGRYNDLHNQGQPAASISLRGINPALVGAATAVLAVNDVAAADWQVSSSVASRSVFIADLVGMGSAAVPASMNKVVTAARAIQGTTSAIAMLKAASQPALNQGVSPGTLAYQLTQAAMLITAGVPCQTYTTSLGGFDTHGGQAYNHAVVLGELDAALQKFFGIIDGSSRAHDVSVLITSEFGRQVSENASGGTDHGRAGVAFVIGGGARGGLYGPMPNLNVRDFDGMIPTVDFRALYATLMNRLGGDVKLTRAVIGLDESGHDFADLGIFH